MSYLPNEDQLTKSLITVDFSHHEIHAGKSFWYDDVVTLGSAATQDYIITVANTTVFHHFGYEIEGSLGITLELFEGTDRNGTTLQTSYNRNRNSSNTPTLTIHKDQTGGSTDGTRILWHKSGTSISGGKVSGTSKDSTERILKNNTKYLMRITSAGASNDVAVRLNWYEH